MSMSNTNPGNVLPQDPNPNPQSQLKVGDKVFIPEHGVWGEVIEFYDETRELVTRVRATINGKPTILEVANLFVSITEAVEEAIPLAQKVWASLKSICQKLGICKKKTAAPPVPAAPAIGYAEVPEALKKAIARAKTRAYLATTKSSDLSGITYTGDPDMYVKEVLKLEKYLP